MQRPTPTTQLPQALRRRRRAAARPLDLIALVPEDVTAAAMDDEEQARQLLDDLVALIDAGLVAPIGSTIAPTALGWATDLDPDAA
jgi:hypothetical protein